MIPLRCPTCGPMVLLMPKANPLDPVQVIYRFCPVCGERGLYHDPAALGEVSDKINAPAVVVNCGEPSPEVTARNYKLETVSFEYRQPSYDLTEFKARVQKLSTEREALLKAELSSFFAHYRETFEKAAAAMLETLRAVTPYLQEVKGVWDQIEREKMLAGYTMNVRSLGSPMPKPGGFFKPAYEYAKGDIRQANSTGGTLLQRQAEALEKAGVSKEEAAAYIQGQSGMLGLGNCRCTLLPGTLRPYTPQATAKALVTVNKTGIVPEASFTLPNLTTSGPQKPTGNDNWTWDSYKECWVIHEPKPVNEVVEKATIGAETQLTYHDALGAISRGRPPEVQRAVEAMDMTTLQWESSPQPPEPVDEKEAEKAREADFFSRSSHES